MLRNARLRLMVVLLVGLTPAFLARADTPAPSPEDQHRQALESYERAEKEWIDLEKEFKDQRVRARLAHMAKEDLLRCEEREQAPQRDKDRVELTGLEAHLDALIPSPTTAPQIALLQTTIQQLKDKEAERIKRLSKLRNEWVLAEEDLRLLERQQGIQRRKALAKLERAEARLAPDPPATPTAKAIQRRLEELDEKMDRLLRVVEQLRREIRRQGK